MAWRSWGHQTLKPLTPTHIKEDKHKNWLACVSGVPIQTTQTDHLLGALTSANNSLLLQCLIGSDLTSINRVCIELKPQSDQNTAILKESIEQWFYSWELSQNSNRSVSPNLLCKCFANIARRLNGRQTSSLSKYVFIQCLGQPEGESCEWRTGAFLWSVKGQTCSKPPWGFWLWTRPVFVCGLVRDDGRHWAHWAGSSRTLTLVSSKGLLLYTAGAENTVLKGSLFRRPNAFVRGI